MKSAFAAYIITAAFQHLKLLNDFRLLAWVVNFNTHKFGKSQKTEKNSSFNIMF